MSFNKKAKVARPAFVKNASKTFKNMASPLPVSIAISLLHLLMVNATDVMIVIDAMDHLKPVNNVNKNALLTKRTRTENFCAGSAPCLTKGLWSGQSNPILLGIVEFSKRKKKRKRRKKKRGMLNFLSYTA